MSSSEATSPNHDNERDREDHALSDRTDGRFHDVGITLIAMGLIGTVILAVGTFFLPALSRAAPLPWPGVREAMENEGKLLVVGCCIFLMLPFVRNAALVRCLDGIDAAVRKRALVVVGLSTTLIALTFLFALK